MTGMVYKSSVMALVNEFFGDGTEPNEVHEAKEMRTILSAYLKVAKKRFIDNVCLLLNLELANFWKELANEIQVTDECLQSIMGDDNATKFQRQQLVLEVDTCRVALDDFKKHFI